MKRVFLFVLDSCGCGEAPDAAAFGDFGVNTMGAISKSPYFACDNVKKLGLAADRFFEIASKSSGQCWSVTTYCPVPGVGPQTPADKGYAGGFATAMMLKDLKLAQDAAAKAGASTPMGAQAEALYAMFDGLGYGGKDFSAFIQMLCGKIAELA